MFYERTVKQTILNVNETFPVLLVTGPRQVGKSTLLENLAEEGRKIVSLDNPTIRALAKTDPELFLQRYAPPVMIDEVQYAPELFPYIKTIVDKRKKNGDFWLTGSQMFRMMQNVTETLSGRVGIVQMLGLTNSEIFGNHFPPFEADPQQLIARIAQAKPMTVTEVFERIYKGSMPAVYKDDKMNLSIFYESYLDTYISRDIRDLEQVANETAFLNFVTAVAARTATVVNYEALAGEVGISAPTAKTWLSLLISCGVVALIQPYSNNALKRVVKSPRMYFLDTGLCAHLLGWGSPQVLENSAMSGAFFETWVVSEIYKSYLNAGKKPPLFYYRDNNKKEIDLIIYQNATVYPIEIKKNTAPANAVKNFSVLNILEQTNEEDLFTDAAQLKTTVGTGLVVCLASDVLPVDKKNWYVPAWLI
ncbi:MAG: ATP-binding protein [Ruminococcaceae bacterium]|nr:ATP-binding protein [Oscillospiraceae bacterium]